MKVEVLELHEHLSHVSTRVEFNGARLVTISGPNGAGKSSLLESIKYVLFDAGRAKGDDLVRLGATDMSALVTFSLNGARYRASRGRTTKSGGKSFLELALEQPDGTWQPLTGETIKDTQACIEQLLGMDAATFATSVFLGQGEANRFAESTPAERKRVLGQVLDLEIYGRAETRTRELARQLEATSAADRDRILRLVDAIAELEPSRGRVDALRVQIHETAQAQTAAAAERDRIQGRLAELAGEIAAGAAAEADVARLEGERSSLADRYRREQKTITDGAAAADTARATLAAADDVDKAIADLPAARAAFERLEQAQAENRRLAQEIEDARRRVDELERPHERDHAAWWARMQAAETKVVEAEGHGKAGTSICEACGQPIGRDIALQQLAAARAIVKELAAAEPKRPLSIDRERAALTRLEARRGEVAVDEGAYVAARARLSDRERDAARGEAIAAARANLATATAAVGEATAELAKISAAGAAVAEQLVSAKAKVAGLAELRARQASVQAELAANGEQASRLERDRHELERQLATSEANLVRLEQLQVEHDELVASTAAAAAELTDLRELITAFGVTGIPARIIESVIPELEAYANALLGELRPGVELSIRAQRAKKDGKGLIEALDLVVRDAAGERPLGLFSGGERMSVSLAIAVALSRLVARRAGAAIRTLVVDEPDGLDADARRAFGQALRVLAHQGELERVVLVSHHEDLAEYGDATYRVIKNGHGSVVEQIS